MPLNDTKARTAKALDKPYRLPDTKGLFLFVTPSGGKLWRWKYRFNGAQKLMAFGKYPEVSLASARERHAAASKLLASGIDPMAERRSEKVAVIASEKGSFEAVAKLWFAHWKVGKVERHVLTTERRMKADILSRLGARPVAEIRPRELVEMMKAIEERGASDVARRALQTASKIFRFAIAHDLAERNPASEIRPSDILKAVPSGNFARIEPTELPSLLKAIDIYKGAQITRLAMKLLAHTFVRTSELIEAKWSEFDLENGRWNIPAERMKMRTPHIVPLARQTVELLKELLKWKGETEWLFPGDRDASKPMSNNTILKALERMGYKGRMTGHGFRGLASTILHERGYDHGHIELQLAHTERDEVSAAYNYALYIEPRTILMQDWADFLEQTQRGGKVILMRQSVA